MEAEAAAAVSVACMRYGCAYVRGAHFCAVFSLFHSCAHTHTHIHARAWACVLRKEDDGSVPVSFLWPTYGDDAMRTNTTHNTLELLEGNGGGGC